MYTCEMSFSEGREEGEMLTGFQISQFFLSACPMGIIKNKTSLLSMGKDITNMQGQLTAESCIFFFLPNDGRDCTNYGRGDVIASSCTRCRKLDMVLIPPAEGSRP